MKDSSAATERVGRYQLLEPIGGGPNGLVSRAKVFGVAGFERQFAVKRFAPELTVGAAAQALSAAARSYGSLEHPRIARMSEFGVAQGHTFTAVEYVAGLDVFRLLQEAKLAAVAIAAGGALALVSQAARAVGYAHGRGLSHLGLSPTNVIVTADGDVKVTDFGILAATMPPHPAESPRLVSRVPYLAPEQISGEATSAASDVFVLGVIAYELVTGQRAYRGESPAQIAQAILAGPPAEPPLPRPIVRVLQRCLARSPFERFPDARALADALDAALRVAPVPGTRKDVGAQVKTTLERYAQLNEGNVSGMVALNLGGGPTAADGFGGSTAIGIGGRPEARTEPSAMPVVSRTVTPPKLPSLGRTPTPQSPSASGTIPEMKPFTTVPGLAPPPIPVPPGVSAPPNIAPTIPPGLSTLPGLSAATKKPAIPAIPRRNTPVPDPEALGASPAVPSAPSSLSAMASEPVFSLPEDDANNQATVLGLAAPVPAAARPPSRPPRSETFDSTTGEMSATQLDALNKRASLATSELPPLEHSPPIRLGTETTTQPDFGLDSQSVSLAEANSVTEFANDAKEVTDSLPEEPAITVEQMPLPRASQPMMPPPMPMPSEASTPGASNKLPLIAGIVLGIGVLGAGGYVAYNELVVKKHASPTTVAATTGSDDKAGSDKAGSDKATPAVTPAVVADAAVAVIATPDAAAVAETPADAAGAIDAGAADAAAAMVAAGSGSGSASAEKPTDVVKPSAPSDNFQVTSKPSGARVFIDGADQGTTPLKIAGSSDQHSLAVLLPGHDLYLQEVDGHGVFDVALTPITPNGGQAGIKVIKCKAKERYYVYVDGKPTGMTCPTERIDTVVGPHTVELYDIVTETRRKFDIVVKDERLSVRVKVDQ